MEHSKQENTSKRDLLAALRIELDRHHMISVDGISANSTKAEIRNALDCLRATDDEMGEYLTVVKLKYPNMHRVITQSNYLKHSHNRLFVFNTARIALA